MGEIIKNIRDTAEIVKVLKQVYNFKANSTTWKGKQDMEAGLERTEEDEV